MITTDEYRKKYAARFKNGKLGRRLPGSADVNALCDAVDSLTRLVEEIQRELPPEIQNKVNHRLWSVFPRTSLTGRR